MVRRDHSELRTGSYPPVLFQKGKYFLVLKQVTPVVTNVKINHGCAASGGASCLLSLELSILLSMAVIFVLDIFKCFLQNASVCFVRHDSHGLPYRHISGNYTVYIKR
jgi:hypothetical protein